MNNGEPNCTTDKPMATYSIGYSVAWQVRKAAVSQSEVAAIQGLEEFTATAADVRIAAAVLRRIGDEQAAAVLMNMLLPSVKGDREHE